MEDINTQETIKYPEVAKEINQMAFIDQDLRQKDVDEPDTWVEEMVIKDKEHYERIKEIINEIGWPTISKVGSEASFNAWLLVQHADHDVTFQEYCLSLMKQEPSGEVGNKELAYLEDRVRVNTKRPQVYGTQFKSIKETNGIFEPREIENAENVEERRKSMGLSTLAENIEEMYRKYKISKPTEPIS